MKERKPTLTRLIDQFLYHCAYHRHSPMKTHQMFPIVNFIRANVLYVRKNAVQRNVAQGANNQSILTVLNLSRELEIQSVLYGALVVGSMLGLNHCKKAVYQLRGQNKQIKRMKNQTKSFVHFDVGENILLPVPEFDKRSPFHYCNLGYVILERTENGLYRIGNSSENWLIDSFIYLQSIQYIHVPVPYTS